MSVLLRDIMTEKVLTLSPAMAAGEASQALVDNHFSGAPVAGDDGKLVGVVSWWDLIGEACDGKTVEELMTPHVVAMKPSDTAESAAKLMLADNIHRIVIMEDGAMVGLVTAMSLLGAFVS